MKGWLPSVALTLVAAACGANADTAIIPAAITTPAPSTADQPSP
jgi:hypothetical protein